VFPMNYYWALYGGNCDRAILFLPQCSNVVNDANAGFLEILA
jgi:hypothetical protein